MARKTDIKQYAQDRLIQGYTKFNEMTMSAQAFLIFFLGITSISVGTIWLQDSIQNFKAHVTDRPFTDLEFWNPIQYMEAIMETQSRKRMELQM